MTKRALALNALALEGLYLLFCFAAYLVETGTGLDLGRAAVAAPIVPAVAVWLALDAPGLYRQAREARMWRGEAEDQSELALTWERRCRGLEAELSRARRELEAQARYIAALESVAPAGVRLRDGAD